jgi:hypothetical protein
MTLLQATTIAVANRLHIRRESWPSDKWIWKHGNTHYGPTWIVFRLSGTERERNGTMPIRATDFDAEDLRADDWTTMPAPLMSCPVTPSIPIGGGPPLPGTPGWPEVPDPGFPSFPGSPGGGGDPSITLPKPDPGTALSVTFAGIGTVDFAALAGAGTAHWELHGSDLDGTRVCAPSGTGVWVGTFKAGNFMKADGVTVDHPGNWKVTVQRFSGSPKPIFSVKLEGMGDFGWVWGEVTRKEKAQEMDNINPSVDIFGGTAKVG